MSDDNGVWLFCVCAGVFVLVGWCAGSAWPWLSDDTNPCEQARCEGWCAHEDKVGVTDSKGCACIGPAASVNAPKLKPTPIVEQP